MSERWLKTKGLEGGRARAHTRGGEGKTLLWIDGKEQQRTWDKGPVWLDYSGAWPASGEAALFQDSP